jgi:rRNA biogenesis protein RRP5
MYLIVSLPNQLFGHVPITNISSQLTSTLENADANSEPEEEENEDGPASDLSEMFSPGQHVRSVVHAVHPSGYTDPMGLSKSRDDVIRASRRVELSLLPEKVNAGVKTADLNTGFVSAMYQNISAVFIFYYRRCRRQSRVWRTMGTFWTWVCPMYQDFCH